MARTYAQVAAVVFAIVGIGGFITGDAARVAHGSAGGNFDGVALHLTYARNVIDLVFAGVFAYAGWWSREDDAWVPVLVVSGLLLALAVIGFIHADDLAGRRALATLHFPLAMNVFDLITGVLGILVALGDYGERPERA
jgi:hypothetical protein